MNERLQNWIDKKKEKFATKNNWFTKGWYILWTAIWSLLSLAIIVVLVWLLLLPDSWKIQIIAWLVKLFPELE